MVRIVPEPHISTSTQELRVPDGFRGDDLERATIDNRELVAAFSRYARHTRGDFKAVFDKWTSMRNEAGLPVDVRYPEETRPTGRLRHQYEQAFKEARAKH